VTTNSVWILRPKTPLEVEKEETKLKAAGKNERVKPEMPLELRGIIFERDFDLEQVRFKVAKRKAWTTEHAEAVRERYKAARKEKALAKGKEYNPKPKKPKDTNNEYNSPPKTPLNQTTSLAQIYSGLRQIADNDKILQEQFGQDTLDLLRQLDDTLLTQGKLLNESVDSLQQSINSMNKRLIICERYISSQSTFSAALDARLNDLELLMAEVCEQADLSAPELIANRRARLSQAEKQLNLPLSGKPQDKQP
jgi:hypothetical protein